MGDGRDYSQFQEGRHLNYWAVDETAQREIERVYDAEDFAYAEPKLAELGAIIGNTVADNADYIDTHGPELHTYDKHGNVQNFVRYPAEQFENERLVYETGLIADCFRAPPEREEPLPLTHFLSMFYLLTYAEGSGFGCPVAMTAGAAHVLELFDDGSLSAYYEALTSREHDEMIEGAMFLTEEQGGSDVGANETTAEYDEAADCWRLTGEKWFCSNIDAEGTLALARTPDAPDGTEGLSMFLVPHGDPDDGVLTKGRRRAFDGPPPVDAVNDQLYRRLKDKLGTTAVPTGEVEFEDTKAYLVGEEQNGFKQMTEMLNLERLSNATGACGIMGRALLESKIHAATREAFGDTIDQYPLMRADLVDMAVDHEAATAFTFEAARLFAEREQAVREGEDAEETYRLMRLLIPIAKLRTARMAIDTTSYAMEIQGGNGYVEEFVTNRLLRDAQVLPIWEGTENILALDVLRALEREDAHEPFMAAMQDRLDGIDHPALDAHAELVEEEYQQLTMALGDLATADGEYAQLTAKRLSNYIFDVFTAALLLEQAQKQLADGEGRLALVARRFIDRELADQQGRGITSGDRFPLEHFDAVVRFASVAPDELLEQARADD
ncbi:acyl-CoA dehydrogenase [Halovenus sp. WSH3]|uniref:Acyl-CoA dehydrogenase n=1 Tax=Halovenus carboxidivorans TaxID=2692199 RepID=A0A6B0TD32_9EURY|nr:acyl-CoA dehydrogenase family protein [Halovenus carboxidivorans]MXR51109.1 acyl-CoA dehydrogenase [Halovenus carboxidivorans]